MHPQIFNFFKLGTFFVKYNSIEFIGTLILCSNIDILLISIFLRLGHLEKILIIISFDNSLLFEKSRLYIFGNKIVVGRFIKKSRKTGSACLLFNKKLCSVILDNIGCISLLMHPSLIMPELVKYSAILE